MSCEVGGKHLKYAIAFAVLVAALVVLCILFFKSIAEDESYSISGTYSHAAVSTDAAQCAKIGRDVMETLNGNAVDSVIATLFCMGLVIPESLGLGGGSFITLYNATTRQFVALDAREVAPPYSYPGMFGSNPSEARYGVRSIAIPGELQAYHKLHSQFGSVPWSQLIEPSIKLAYEGFTVGEHFASAIASKWKLINDSDLRAVLTDPSTGQPYVEGSKMKRIDLAETFKSVSREGVNAMYSPNGSVVNELIRDLNGKGSNLTVDDIVNYQINQYEPYAYKLANGHTLYSVEAPASGLVLAFIVDVVLQSFQGHKLPLTTQVDTNLYYARLIEAYKFGYALRSFLGDPHFDNTLETEFYLRDPAYRRQVVTNILTMTATNDNSSYYYPESLLENASSDPAHDQGTSAVVVVDTAGSTVAVCSSINQYFGSFVISQSTGIMMNDVMDDFSSNFTNQYGVETKTSFNKVEPGKRPMSSMAPVIVTNDLTGQVVLALGASGGSKITSAVANIILRSLLFEKQLDVLIEEKRIHHQLIPMLVEYEDGFDKEALKYLRGLGHQVKGVIGRTSIVMAIQRMSNGLYRAVTDPRKMGAVDGF